MSLKILHRRRILNQIMPIDYIDTTGLLYGFSFRQLTADSTYAIRQYSNDGTTFQDVGFVDGYINKTAITTFAAGAITRFEWYDQLSNILKYVKTPTSLRPKITNSSGSLILDDSYVMCDNTETNSRLYISSATFPATVSSFQVNKDVNTNSVSKMLNSSGDGKWIGAMALGNSTSPTSGAGSPTFWKNGVQITPINRDILYAALTNIKSQHSVRNANLSTWTKIYKGYDESTIQYYPLNYSFEELIYNSSLMSPTQITDLENNQIYYYNI